MTLLGPDVSHHQGRINWSVVPCDFAIVKATQGTGFVDSQFFSSANQLAGDNRLVFWGAYHFGDGSDPRVQAAHFIDTVKPWLNQANFLPVLDFEANPVGPDMTPAQAAAFMAELYKARAPHRVCVYAGDYQLPSLAPYVIFADVLRWIPRYSHRPEHPFTLWQYGDGRPPANRDAHSDWPYELPGIGPVDTNVYEGDAVSLRKVLGIETEDELGDSTIAAAIKEDTDDLQAKIADLTSAHATLAKQVSGLHSLFEDFIRGVNEDAGEEHPFSKGAAERAGKHLAKKAP